MKNALDAKADAATTLSGYGITDGANTNLSNLTATGKNVCAHAGMPGTNYSNLTLGTSGSGYLAPADGYIHLAVSSWSGVSGGVLYMYISSPRCGLSTRYQSSDWVDMSIPVSKGQTVIIQYNGTPTVSSFIFIYANAAS